MEPCVVHGNDNMYVGHINACSSLQEMQLSFHASGIIDVLNASGMQWRSIDAPFSRHLMHSIPTPTTIA